MVQCCSLEHYAYICILNKLLIFLIFGQWKVNVVQIFWSFLLVFLLLTLCSIRRLSFSSRCCGKLLFLAVDYIISHSVCFLSGLRGKECILVMWNIKAAIFVFYGVIRKKVNSCVCSGWFPLYIYFRYGVSACYCQIEKGYGILFFVCGVKF